MTFQQFSRFGGRGEISSVERKQDEKRMVFTSLLTVCFLVGSRKACSCRVPEVVGGVGEQTELLTGETCYKESNIQKKGNFSYGHNLLFPLSYK